MARLGKRKEGGALYNNEGEAGKLSIYLCTLHLHSTYIHLNLEFLACFQFTHTCKSVYLYLQTRISKMHCF
jgi:hypothetical protein